MSKKNLIYIFADQWRAHAVGFANADPVLTENMDEFAAEGMQFSNAISTYPLCSPHRASLLTGKYPTSCGFWTNCKPGLDEKIMLKPQEICVSDCLHEAGYRTGYIGKWHLDASELNFFNAPKSGARDWDAYTPKGERRHHFETFISYGAMDNHTDPHYWQDSDEMIKPKKYSPEFETDMALEFLQKQDERPFSLFVSWNPPHPPYDLIPEEALLAYSDFMPQFRENVPQEMRENETYLLNMKRYFSAITALDKQFGRIISYLKENSLWGNTIVVLSSDHGDMMGSHGLYGKNVWYEESIRIPLVFGGGGIKNGSCSELFTSVDHMPTLLSLLDIPVPDTVEGVSLAREVTGEKSGELPDTAFLCMIPGMPDMVMEYTKLGLNNRCFGWRGVRTKTHTYIVDNGTAPGAEQQRLLYNNQADPYQLNPTLLRKGEEEYCYYSNILKGYLSKLNDRFLL